MGYTALGQDATPITQMSNMFLTLCKVRSSELWQCVTDAHTENLQGVREMGILVTICYFNNF